MSLSNSTWNEIYKCFVGNDTWETGFRFNISIQISENLFHYINEKWWIYCYLMSLMYNWITFPFDLNVELYNHQFTFNSLKQIYINNANPLPRIIWMSLHCCMRSWPLIIVLDQGTQCSIWMIEINRTIKEFFESSLSTKMLLRSTKQTKTNTTLEWNFTFKWKHRRE